MRVDASYLRQHRFTAEYYSSELLGEEYGRFVHASGLTVYVFPKKCRNTYGMLSTHYGSINNDFRNKGETAYSHVPEGIAHFLEHKLFANKDGSDALEQFAALGADGNAFTSYDKTAYLFNCTSRVKESLDTLLSFVTHPYFVKESVEKEKSIIQEELRMELDNPDEQSFIDLMCDLYEFHPVRNNICGTMDSIERITPEDLYRCYTVFYHPSNMELIVCGNIEPETVLSAVSEQYPPEAEIRPIEEKRIEESPEVFKKFSRRNMQVAQPIFCIGVKDTAISDDPVERMKKDTGMSLLNEMLFSHSGQFFSDLFESHKLTGGCSSGYSITPRMAFNVFSGESDNPDEILTLYLQYIKETKEKGLSAEDLSRCKKILYSDYVKSFDNSEEIAHNLLGYIMDGFPMFDYPDILQSITLEYLTDLLFSVFREEATAMAVIDPLPGTKGDENYDGN